MIEKTSQALRRAAGLMIVTYVLAVVLAVIASVQAESAARLWRTSTDAIVTQALPTLERLSQTRAELRRLQTRLGELVSRAEAGRPTGALGTAALSSWERLESTARDAFDTPSLPGDAPDRTRLEVRLRASDVGVREVLQRVQEGQPAEARRVLEESVQPQLERLDTLVATERSVLHRLITSSHAAMLDRRHAGRVLRYVLEAAAVACALLGIGAAFLLVRRENRVSAARMNELEMFAGRVAHDIRSPLTTLSLGLESLRRAESHDPRALATLERSQRILRAAQQIIDGLLVFAKAGAAPVGNVTTRVEPIVSGVLEQLGIDARDHGVTLEARVDDALVRCHPGVLTSIVSNLVGNAIRYMGESPLREVLVEARRSGECLRLQVSDTGPGVPEELRKTVFEPWVRGKEARGPGIGLGLATVRRLAEAHGGGVSYAPAPGGGSVFTVLLPCARGAEAAGEPSSARH